MKTVKGIRQESAAFRYMMEQLAIYSAPGRNLLLNLEMMTTVDSIQKELDLLGVMVLLLQDDAHKLVFEQISHQLPNFKDIHTTLANLGKYHVPDDLELFEIKHFALLAGEIATLLQSIQFDQIGLPDLGKVVELLDPEQQHIPHFYIFSAYSNELLEIRSLMRSCPPDEQQKLEQLRSREQQLEEEIRKDLGAQLAAYTADLASAFQNLAQLDLLLAKARLAIQMNCCRPVPVCGKTTLEGLFNPLVQSFLEQEDRRFQPINLTLDNGPVLVTGANMGGKTVLLKSIMLAQYLFQFGFFVPASLAIMEPMEEIWMNHGENRPEKEGLSSFGAEMAHLGSLLVAVKSGKKTLALLDEPACTTNPDEGKAIVNAIVDFLAANKVRSIVTTHYSGIESPCRRLRVKGLDAQLIKGDISHLDLNRLMDYSLLEHHSPDAPAVGILIAGMLGLDKTLVEKAWSYYHRQKTNDCV